MIGHVIHWTVWLLGVFLAVGLLVWQFLNPAEGEKDPEWTTRTQQWFALTATVLFGIVLLALVRYTP